MAKDATPKEVKFLSLRLDPETLEKFKVVAASNGRAMIREAEALIKESIRLYERKHGAIAVSARSDESK